MKLEWRVISPHQLLRNTVYQDYTKADGSHSYFTQYTPTKWGYIIDDQINIVGFILTILVYITVGTVWFIGNVVLEILDLLLQAFTEKWGA